MRRQVVAVGIVAGFVAAGCGSASSGGSPTGGKTTAANSDAAAIAQIKAHWTAFYDASTPQATQISYLEDGPTLVRTFEIGAKLAKKEHLVESAKVSNVKLVDPTHATVTYQVLSHGQVLLPTATGNAVLQNGTWKVAKSTFCTLIQLGAGGQTLPGC